MNGAVVVMLICAAAIPREQCTEQTARVYLSTRIEQPVCGAWVLTPPPYIAVEKDEFARVKCTR